MGALSVAGTSTKQSWKLRPVFARAGGYVVGVENGVMRSLTAEEESEFQCAIPRDSTDNPAETTVATVSRSAATIPVTP